MRSCFVGLNGITKCSFSRYIAGRAHAPAHPSLSLSLSLCLSLLLFQQNGWKWKIPDNTRHQFMRHIVCIKQFQSYMPGAVCIAYTLRAPSRVPVARCLRTDADTFCVGVFSNHSFLFIRIRSIVSKSKIKFSQSEKCGFSFSTHRLLFFALLHRTKCTENGPE